MKAYIIKYPVTGFIILTFFISLVIGLPLKLFVLNGVFTGSEIGLSYLSKILVVSGPGIAAVVVTGVTSGSAAVAKLLGKLKPDSKHIIWWLGLPFAGIAITTAAFVIGGFTFKQFVVMLTAASPFLLLLHFLCALFLIGFGEELGWRGWLLRKLATGKPIGRVMLLVFITWALWHLPMFFTSYKVAIPFVIIVFALSVIFTRLWHHVDGNLFVLALAHASVDFPEAFFEARIGEGHTPEILNAWAVMAIIYLAIAAVVYFSDKRWWDKVLIEAPE